MAALWLGTGSDHVAAHHFFDAFADRPARANFAWQGDAALECRHSQASISHM